MPYSEGMAARSAPRFWFADLSTGRAVLTGGQAHHALHVLRLGPGADVVLFDGAGGVAAGRIVSTGRSELTVAIDRRLTAGQVAGPPIDLAFAVPKGKRLDWLLEKATELGAASLQPVVFERSTAGRGELSPAKQQRWTAHCIAAARQCGLDYLPQIRRPAAPADLAAVPAEALGLLGSAAPDAPPVSDVLGRWRAGMPVHILVGPAGGLMDDESALAAEAGFAPARLGHTRLRTETAAIALLAAAVSHCR